MPADVMIVETWTEGIDAVLMADGLPADLTGATVTILIRDKAGVLQELDGVVTVPDAEAGEVRFTPAADDLPASGSPYSVRWRVEGGGKVVFFPNEDVARWVVNK